VRKNKTRTDIAAGEFRLIERLASGMTFGEKRPEGIGDDAAVLDYGRCRDRHYRYGGGSF
jgi:hypothetical protein